MATFVILLFFKGRLLFCHFCHLKIFQGKGVQLKGVQQNGIHQALFLLLLSLLVPVEAENADAAVDADSTVNADAAVNADADLDAGEAAVEGCPTEGCHLLFCCFCHQCSNACIGH